MNDLGVYEVELEQIQFALGDIKETLQIWRDEKPITDPYMVKLWREWDELIARKAKLLNAKGKDYDQHR